MTVIKDGRGKAELMLCSYCREKITKLLKYKESSKGDKDKEKSKIKRCLADD